MCTYTHIHMHAHTHTQTHAHTIHIHAHMHAHIHVHTHIHAHTQKLDINWVPVEAWSSNQINDMYHKHDGNTVQYTPILVVLVLCVKMAVYTWLCLYEHMHITASS